MAESSSCKVFRGLGEVCGYTVNEASLSAYFGISDIGKDVGEEVGNDIGEDVGGDVGEDVRENFARAADVLSIALR